MLDSISSKTFSHVLLFSNSLKAQTERGISAAAAIVFTDGSRIVAWYVRQPNGEFDWTCPQLPIHVKDDLVVNVTAFFGPISNDILGIARRSRQRVVKERGRVEPQKVYKVTKDKVEEVNPDGN